MAYNITLTNGTTLISGGLADGTADQTSTSLVLIGKNYSGYGKFLNENFVHLAENFANSTAPSAPLTGQIWYDTTNKQAKINFGTKISPIWKTLAGQTAGTSQPSAANSVIGDLWWDTAKNQLNAYAGAGSWVVVGPAFTSLTGQSGAISESITDSVGGSHVVVKFYIANQLVSILNKDATFTPQTAIPGFATIKPGYNLNSTATPSLAYYGDADNASKLGGVEAANYAQLDGTAAFTTAQTIEDDAGLTIGLGGDLELSVSGGTTATITNTTSNGNMAFYVTVGSTATQAMLVNGTSGLITVAGDPTTSLGVATKAYVDAQLSGGVGGATEFSANIVPSANLTYNIGSPTVWWNNIYGRAIQAKYADLAERFAADEIYNPGTVVELGGAAEITKVGEELSENVFGVISTNAAYLMNAGAGSDQTHPPVAVQGRVPVCVIGRVKKGDRLVSAGNGMARSASKSEITPWNVIGRALESKATDGEGTIEAVVKLNS